MRVAALYDIHGNLRALDAILAVAKADEIVIGGDIVLGGRSRETLDRVMALGPRTHVIRGNCDRLVVDAFDGRALPPKLPTAVQNSITATAAQLDQRHRDYLAVLPETIVLGSVLFCHATPRDDDEIFAVDTPADAVRLMFAGVTQPLVVCGHTHVQFDRAIDGLRIVNAGSVGMPLGPPGAYWVLLDPDVHLMRTDV
ncbi:MAG TPA: metallophosphoesterase family protein [Gemmatimonadaceae bacterium]|nr:metallophosphoesterase family protein [Gemmatimonadaceae bacterium]